LNDSWKSEKLAYAPLQIIDGDRGNNYPKQNELSDSGYCLFLNAGNVTGRGFDFTECQFITEGKDNLLRKGRLARDDIVMTTRGTIGNIGFFNNQVPYDNVRINSGMVIFRCETERLVPSYLYHFLRSPYFKGHVNALRSGVAQPQLPIKDMKYIDIPLPLLDTQHHIADMLSAYDDLIENNRRRIGLLEQSARLLYKEWLVHLRFPGHEHVRIIDGVPDGWRKLNLSELVDTQYGFTETASYEPVGPKFLRGTDINKTPYIDWSTVPYCSEEKLDFPKYALSPGDIVVIRMADPGKVAIIEKEIKAVFASYLVRMKVRASAEVPPLYMYYVLSDDRYQRSIAGASEKSTRKSASAKLLTDFNLVKPSKALLLLFVEQVQPLRQQINVLLDQKALLEHSRDLLLPHLMNGEIAV